MLLRIDRKYAKALTDRLQILTQHRSGQEMNNKICLTIPVINRLTCPPDRDQVFLWDTDTEGLGVRATPTGRKTYVLQSRLNGASLRINIGSTKSLHLDCPAKSDIDVKRKTARFIAREMQSQINAGVDPRLERKRNIAENEAARDAEQQASINETMQNVLVADAWATYIEQCKKHWGDRHLRDHVKLAQAGGFFNGKDRAAGPLASLMTRKLADLNADTLKDWLSAETCTRPTQAALAYRLLRAFVNWCAEFATYRDLVRAEMFTTKSVRKLVPRKKAKSDLLQLSQFPAWFQSVRRISSPTMAAYLQILLLTGARREELASLRWENIDFKWGSMRIRDKVEGERVIPLTPFVASLLTDLKHRNETPPAPYRILEGKRIANNLLSWRPSPWVFSSSSACGHIVAPTNAHARAVKDAGLPNVSLNGLRRTFNTQSGDIRLELPKGVSAQIMGHKPSATAEMHYIWRPLDALRAWHIRIERFFIESAELSFDYDTPAKAQTLRVV